MNSLISSALTVLTLLSLPACCCKKTKQVTPVDETEVATTTIAFFDEEESAMPKRHATERVSGPFSQIDQNDEDLK